jgi:HAE1 family hydrophobic/amphiphilic exporter-1
MNKNSSNSQIDQLNKNYNQDLRFNFNYQITKYFINNNKLTVILLVLLVLAGSVSAFLLKTTGFPNPDINISIIQTVYPGASSKTINDEVTKPIENSIKSLEGIESYTSESQNNFSIITVTLVDDENIESTKNKIDSAVKSTPLPEGANEPTVFAPRVSGPNYIFSVYSKSKELTYEISKEFSDKINNLELTSEVTETNKLEKVLLITLDQEKIQDFNINRDLINLQLSNLGTELPVVSNIDIQENNNNSNSAIQTKLDGTTLDDIKNLNFTSVQAQNNQIQNPRQPTSTNFQTSIPQVYKFSDFADIRYDYRYEDKIELGAIISKNEDKQVIYPNVLVVKTLENVDQAQYKKELDEIANNIDNVEYVKGIESIDFDDNNNYIIENYNINTLNQDQVDEVIGGLVGSRLDLPEPFDNLGFLLGGIQLVFLVMLAFVSWRAAIVAAISIPLSLVFTTIYLYSIGETLNTLVLFSLVLVIGLVVDPALVILESIQRKVDVGFRGKEAALEAVKDVGTGLFLATLTNIIVFLPFGLISGIIGKIFVYIPLTIIPATIGSYIVPLIFLSWFAGLILKPNKNKTSSEEENLWPIAQALVKLNKWILKSSVYLRILIIIICLVIPFVISSFLIGSGQLKIVQFASDKNSQFLLVSGSYKSLVSFEERNEAAKKVLEILSQEKDVQQVYPLNSGVNYYVELKPIGERDERSIDLSTRLTESLQNEVGENSPNPKFFDITVALDQNGPPSSDYQVAIAINTENQDILQKSAKDIESNLNLICFTNSRTVIIDNECDGQRIVEKIDNGFDGKENNIIEIDLDRNSLAQYGLIGDRSPLISTNVTNIIKSQFDLNNPQNSLKFKTAEEELDIILESTQNSPKTIEELENLVVTVDQNGREITLSDISTITKSNPAASISRVNGKTVGVVNARLSEGNNDQNIAAQVTQAITDYYSENDFVKTKALGLEENAIGQYSEGSSASTVQSFQDLLLTLVVAIILSYLVLVIFFQSLLLPIVILFTIPLTFIGMFPALAYFGGGELGFLEIIGVIILIGIVENVAIFLIDGAKKYIKEGQNENEAISLASGIRFRPVLLTTFTAVASLAPLAIASVFYRSISVVIIFGLLTSGFLSLITTPILFRFFNWLPVAFGRQKLYNKLIFLAPLTIFPIVLGIFALTQQIAFEYVDLNELTQLILVSFGVMILISIISLFTFRKKTEITNKINTSENQISIKM